ncbi:MAG: HPr family phosphocarrier protein [Lachnospiraceae bacterium]|nr:HPr family phosphocarrier protein [Lachnospiraceae bacterium]
MKTFDYMITDPEGIHARPAGILVKEAAKFASKITIAKDGREVDAKRIMGVMSLGVKKDHTVTVKTEGEDEDAACSALETFFKENL